MIVTIPIERLKDHGDQPLPTYETSGSAGMDISASGPGLPVTLEPGQRALISSGLKMALPAGFEAQIRPRSGLALNHGLTVLNAPGTIDSDYRGEIKVLLINMGQAPITLHQGDRIAQMVISPFVEAQWSETASLETTRRGDSGFGSTGRAGPTNTDGGMSNAEKESCR